MSGIYRPKGRAQEFSWLALNHYYGCGHRCKYCYVPSIPGMPDQTVKPRPVKNIIEKVRKQAREFAGTDERVLLSFTCDPYQPLDDELNLTRQIMLILKAHDIPFQILTKGGTRAVKDFDLYGRKDAFAATLTFLDYEDSINFEPWAATPLDRMIALFNAHKRGIETWVSLEPVIDAKQSLKIIDETHGFVKLYKIGKLNYQKSSINWRKFGIAAIKKCREYKVDYYIKKDLAEYLDGVTFYNIDNRKVEKS